MGSTAGTLATLVDLVLPSDCAGCGAMAGFCGVCATCASALAGAPGATRPTPAPDALPPCLSVGEYDGPLRELILAYKERGRRRLAAPLGDALAGVALAGVAVRAPWRLVLVPVPATAAAVRSRQGDHMLRLARRAVRRLRHAGVAAAVCSPVRARRRPDSAQLDRRDRALTARSAFAVRPGRARVLRSFIGAGAAAGVQTAVVLLDDVLTTGSTLAAVAGRLADAGVDVAFAATLAATRLRRVGSLAPIEQISWDGSWDWG